MPCQLDHLPQEVLGLILKYLPESSYASLRLINPAWNTLLRPHIFRDLCVGKSCERNLEILDDMERSLAESHKHTPIGNLVRSLNMGIPEEMTGSDLVRLASVCPSVTNLSALFDIFIDTELQETGADTVKDSLLEHTADSTTDGVSSGPTSVSTFFTSLGNTLTQLTFNRFCDFGLLINTILPPLAHLVKLEIYTGYRPVATYNDNNLIEDIRRLCPHLKSLAVPKHSLNDMEKGLNLDRLKSQTVADIQDALAKWSSDIRPWPGLTQFSLNININKKLKPLGGHLPILLYLVTKFPDLQSLRYSARVTWSPLDPLTSGDRKLLDALAGGRHVFTKLRSVSLTHTEFDPFITLIVLNHNMESPTITAAPVTLESLNLDYITNSFQNRTMYLHNLTNFVRQPHFFNHTLTTLTIADENMRYNDMLALFDPALNSIKRLTLKEGSRDEIIRMDLILDKCRRLEHLELHEMKIAQPTTTRTTNHPLYELVLSYFRVESTEIFTWISDCCRQLTILTIKKPRIKTSPSTVPLPPDLNENRLLKPNSITCIDMPYTRLMTCTLHTPMIRCGSRYKYIHGSYLMLFNNCNKPSVLYSKLLNIAYDSLVPIKMYDFRNNIFGTSSWLDVPKAQTCVSQIKSHGMVVFLCQDIKDLKLTFDY
ncbi:hypothetical protein BC941DRAFT_424874 [Chlamydoabsidia padenii]|nr:hypothetical protein BC941DRAFT_424874 [Chlamydoabsidia padenii]